MYSATNVMVSLRMARRWCNGRRILWTLLGISVITFMTLALFQSATINNLPVRSWWNGKARVQQLSFRGGDGNGAAQTSDGEGPEEDDDNTSSDDTSVTVRPAIIGKKNKGKKPAAATTPRNDDEEGEVPPTTTTKNSKRKCARDGSIILVRIVGNDLSGRHAQNQSLSNLKFILRNEPTHPRLEKVWLFNRIFDGLVEESLIGLVTHYRYKYIPLHFDMEEYAKRDFVYDALAADVSPKIDKFRNAMMTALTTGQTDQMSWHAVGYMYSSKNLYAINNNGARNTALEYGRRKCKHWIMPWDGNSFLTKQALNDIIATLDAPKNKNKRYFYVPMHRMLTPNKDLLSPSFVPNAIDEPQVIFRNDAKERFDEAVPYGRRPKVDLFWRTGFPGPWDHWPILPFDKPKPPVVEPDSFVANVSWVARLYSGNAKLEEGGQLVARGNARYMAIRTFLDFLDLQNVNAALDPKYLLAFDQSALTNARDLYRQCHHDVLEGRMVGDIIKRADEALTRGPYSVIDKPKAGPSGDKHDYYHPAPYWWPNEDSVDGTPYIRKDGLRRPGTVMYEPESDLYDRTRLQMMYDDTTATALAWYFTGDAKYAKHGAKLVQTWFLDPATAMNPSMDWAQFTPGVLVDKGFGIMDTKDMYYFLDAVRLLVASKYMNRTQHQQFQGWIRSLTEWMTTNKRGHSELAAENNHGTYYDLQIAALYAASDQLLKLHHVIHRSRLRLFTQFTLNGTQPKESTRTRPLHYYLFNIQGWRGIAKYASMLGIDLTSGAPGRNLLAGIHHVANVMDGLKLEEEYDPYRIVPIQMWANQLGILDQVRGYTFQPRADTTPWVLHPHTGVQPYWFFTFPHAATLPFDNPTPVTCPAAKSL